MADMRRTLLTSVMDVDLDPSMEQLRPYVPTLNRYLEDYLVTGGTSLIHIDRIALHDLTHTSGSQALRTIAWKLLIPYGNNIYHT